MGFLASAVVKLFKGDFEGAMNDAKSAGKELIDVTTGVDGSFEKIVDKTGQLSDAVSNYTSKVVESASKM